MSLPTTRLSYVDCFDILDQCLDHERGVRVKMPDFNSANFFRMRLHQARTIVRNENKAIYERDHNMWGSSQYDGIAVKIRQEGDAVWVYLEKITSMDLVVEPIDGPIPQIEHRAPLQITLRMPDGVLQGEVLAPIKRRV